MQLKLSTDHIMSKRKLYDAKPEQPRQLLIVGVTGRLPSHICLRFGSCNKLGGDGRFGTVALMKIQVYWRMAPRRLVKLPTFRRRLLFLCSGTKYCSWATKTVKREAASFSETSLLPTVMASYLRRSESSSY